MRLDSEVPEARALGKPEHGWPAALGVCANGLGYFADDRAVSSIGLIIHSRVNALSLTCVVVTSFFTTVGVFLVREEVKQVTLSLEI